MKIEVLNEVGRADCLILPIWEDKKLDAFAARLDKRFGNAISGLLEGKDVDGKSMQSAILYTQDKQLPRVFVVGLGKHKELTARTLKHAVGAAVRACQDKKWQKLSCALPIELIKKFDTRALGKDIAYAAEVAAYSFDTHKNKESRVKPVNSFAIVGEFDGRARQALERGVEEGAIIGQATNFTRELGNTSPSIMTPTLLAEKAQGVAAEFKTVRVKVLSLPDIKKLGMGCFLGVAQGSVEEPKFIIVEYFGAAKSQAPIVLVGKGITFDSGGLSLKPAAYMSDMKFDMLGAATALGSVKAAAALGIKKNIVALLPSCENMPSGASYRPDDILTNMDGKSVLVDNTDAEGRLILCDALSYAKKYNPREVIDFATLTGACMITLGNERSGLFSPDNKLAARLEKSADAAGEQLWRLPLGPEYTEALKSEVADVVNTGFVGGKPGYGASSTAAAFLEFFTQDKDGKPVYPWAHIDLSSSFYGGKGKPYIRGGANGFGVATMVEYLRN